MKDRARGWPALVCLALLAAATCPAAATTLEDARRAYVQAQYPRALEQFRQLANAGDARAQLLLGLVLAEGKHAPRDAVEAFAWLDLASADRRWGDDVAEQAWDAKIALLAGLSGAELIEAERRVADYWRASAQRASGVHELAAKAFGVPDPVTPPMDGCAVGARFAGCPKSPASTDAARCGGSVPLPQVGPTLLGPAARVNLRRTRPAALDEWSSYRTVYVAHVDASGLVCRVAVLESSGDSTADRLVQQTVAQSLFEPATLDGRPVASYAHGAMVIQGLERR